MDFNRFFRGDIMDAYNYLGAHVEEGGVTFRTYAPNADAISVIGEFNNWTETPMHRGENWSFFECFIDEAREGQMYKYRIYDRDGNFVDHSDPYGFGMQLRPDSASIIRDLSAYTFHDKAWMKKRTDCKKTPLNIYELHMGSFKKPGPKKEDWYTYSEMIDVLIPYLKEMGYNYIEVMPLSEHPCDESWGYQNTGFFAPTARYGTATQLMEFVDACHQNDIGVIVDYVPVHFAVDGYALANYDSTPLFEYPHPDVAYSEWGSCNFNLPRGEVRSFLQSAANYWLEVYHMDGLRMDAISRVLYWQGNEDRGQNTDGIEFLKHMNNNLKDRHPSALLSAEDSTSYPGVTVPVDDGGLGFDYKWDMGWMNDTLNYFRLSPLFRGDNYHKLTFSMMYFYNENFMLPLSHDETVHGKATILQKMFGNYEDKFPQARALYMYMYSHPGKKLNFMGNEIGQLREWDEKREQDWFILKYPIHDSFHEFIKRLNHLYLEHPAFSEKDFEFAGFEWLDCHSEDRCLYTFERRSSKERILAIFNFSGIEQQNYELFIPNAEKLTLLLASDEDTFSGPVHYNDEDREILVTDEHVTINVTPLSGSFYLIGEKTKKAKLLKDKAKGKDKSKDKKGEKKSKKK